CWRRGGSDVVPTRIHDVCRRRPGGYFLRPGSGDGGLSAPRTPDRSANSQTVVDRYRRGLGTLAPGSVDGDLTGCPKGGMKAVDVWIWSAMGVGVVVIFVLGSGGFAVLVVALSDKLFEWMEERIYQRRKDEEYGLENNSGRKSGVR